MNYTYNLLAGILLYSGQFERAGVASERAIQYAIPSNRHHEYALYGLIQVTLEKMQEAHNAFNIALDHAAELLENTPNLYSPKYSRGLALMGLALVTNDMTYIEDSKLAYLEARQNCDAKGIVSREMKKLNLLTGSGSGGETGDK
jgi:tetratricopeptide (TPR) repeat protein